MRVAQIPPLHEAVPPKLYGGTERVVSYLTEALAELGHDVTLFATGDSVTSARLHPVWPRALRLDPAIRDPVAPHMLLMEEVRRLAGDFDVLHFHMDYWSFSLFSRQRVPFVTTLHGRLDLPELQPVFNMFPNVPVVSISNCAAPAAAAGELRLDGAARAAREPPDAAARRDAELSRLPRPHRAREGAGPRDPHRPALRHPDQDRGQGRPRRSAVFRRGDPPDAERAGGRDDRRDQRGGETRLPLRRARSGHADRLAGAVRAGDDRGDGVRRAGDRVQPRLRPRGDRGRADRVRGRGRGGRDRCRRPAAADLAPEGARPLRAALHRAAHGRGLPRDLPRPRRPSAARCCASCASPTSLGHRRAALAGQCWQARAASGFWAAASKPR